MIPIKSFILFNNLYKKISNSNPGGAGDAGYGSAGPEYRGAAPAYDSYSQPCYNTYQQPQSQYNNTYGKYHR